MLVDVNLLENKSIGCRKVKVINFYNKLDKK